MFVVLLAALVTAHTFALALEPPRDPRASASSPLTSVALEADERFVFEGEVLERLEAGSYVYLRVADGGGGAGAWVATLAATDARAPRVRVTAIGRARGFESRRLGRRFDVLVFGVVRAAAIAAN